MSSAADCSPIGLRFVLNLAYRGRSSIRQRDPAGFTRSSTTDFQVHVGFHYNNQIELLITTNVCELSFDLPKIEFA